MGEGHKPNKQSAETSDGAAALAAGSGDETVHGWLTALLSGEKLSPKSRQIGLYILSNPRLAAFQSASEVAASLGVNSATVVRFAQTLGFKGWPAFQLELRHRYLSTLLPAEVMRQQGFEGAATEGAPTLTEATLRRDIDNLHTALESVDSAEVEAVAQLIAGADRVVVVSAGSYSAVGVVLAHLGSFMGFPITLETRAGPSLMAALGGLGERDCVIGISFWRLAKHVVLALESAQRRGVATVAMTDSPLSPLAASARHTLVVPTDSVLFFQSVAAAVSVAYALLATLQVIGGPAVDRRIVATQELYSELDVLYS